MAYPIPTGFDPVKMLEFLANQPGDEQMKILGELDVEDEVEAQNQRTRAQEAMVKRFKEMRARFLGPAGPFGDQLPREMLRPGMVQTSFSFCTDTKPSFTTSSLHSLKPMIGDELDIGTTHRGRYLCGWVAVADAFFGISSSVLLIEDVTGYLVEAAAYGLVNTDLPPRERQRRVAAQFPMGKPIVVIEPYYKVRMDGSVGIRVDNPNEMIAWSDVPTDLVTWKKFGNKFFHGINILNGGRGSLACYQRALEYIQPQLREIAVLLANIATCRFKMGDYKVAIQLSGAAVHLDPAYFKGWLRLAAALVENDGAGKRDSKLVAARVVAHACTVIPILSRRQCRMLENTITAVAATPDCTRFQSYAERCVELQSPAFVVLSDRVVEMDSSKETKAAGEWCKVGSENFNKGDMRAAEECYRKGLMASLACCRDVSVVLNNIAAVYLTLYQENSVVLGISVGEICSSSSRSTDRTPSTEAALLNCTVAGIVDPLNYKAWTRRARCLGKLGFSPQECIADLNAIHDSAMTLVPSSDENRLLIEVFEHNINAEILQLSAVSKTIHHVSDVPTEVQREKRDAMNPDRLPSAAWHEKHDDKSPPPGVAGEEENIDEYIARMEAFENMSRLAFAASKSNLIRQKKEMPREMKMFVGNPPPQIHIDFPKLRGWPDGIDPTFARKVLYRAYLDASANPWVKASAMREGTYSKIKNIPELVKRWQGMGALEILNKKAASLKYGDIIDGREAINDFVPAYDARIRSNFANNPSRAEVYFFGTTHVAIGFNDFSSLISTNIHGKSNAIGPLKFVGFEMSEFAVAKCKVVAQMLGFPGVSISSVMEVWLSSTWSKITLKDFRKCVSAVLASPRERDENPKVKSYLNHWASTEPISATKARSEFFLNLERYNKKALGALFSFRREIDRLDLAQYIFTGEIRMCSNAMDLVKSERINQTNEDVPQTMTRQMKKNKKKRDRKKKNTSETVSEISLLVGSLTMWNVPPGAPPLEEDVALNTVDFMTILEDYANREKKKKGSTDKLSVVDLFTTYILENLQRLRGLLLSGKLTIEIKYGVVKAVRGEVVNDRENNELLRRIAMMRPYTISWSNVLDYFMPEDFHDLARRCSMYGDCMHYGYSMNWTTQVLGASIMDFTPEDDQQLIDAVLDSALGFKSGQLGLSSVDLFKSMGLDKLLFLPFRDNPLNSTAYGLAQVSKKHWIEHFLSKGQLTEEAILRLGAKCTPVNCGLQKGFMESAMPSPLYRTSLTLYMSWCYDPEMTLHAANDPFAVGAAASPDMLKELIELSGEQS